MAGCRACAQSATPSALECAWSRHKGEGCCGEGCWGEGCWGEGCCGEGCWGEGCWGEGCCGAAKGEGPTPRRVLSRGSAAGAVNGVRVGVGESTRTGRAGWAIGLFDGCGGAAAATDDGGGGAGGAGAGTSGPDVSTDDDAGCGGAGTAGVGGVEMGPPVPAPVPPPRRTAAPPQATKPQPSGGRSAQTHTGRPKCFPRRLTKARIAALPWAWHIGGGNAAAGEDADGAAAEAEAEAGGAEEGGGADSDGTDSEGAIEGVACSDGAVDTRCGSGHGGARGSALVAVGVSSVTSE